MQPNFPDERSETERHSFMAVVEWWILAHSNWLVGHVGSSFAETAGSEDSHGMGWVVHAWCMSSPYSVFHTSQVAWAWVLGGSWSAWT